MSNSDITVYKATALPLRHWFIAAYASRTLTLRPYSLFFGPRNTHSMAKGWLIFITNKTNEWWHTHTHTHHSPLTTAALTAMLPYAQWFGYCGEGGRPRDTGGFLRLSCFFPRPLILVKKTPYRRSHNPITHSLEPESLPLSLSSPRPKKNVNEIGSKSKNANICSEQKNVNNVKFGICIVKYSVQ